MRFVCPLPQERHVINIKRLSSMIQSVSFKLVRNLFDVKEMKKESRKRENRER